MFRFMQALAVLAVVVVAVVPARAGVLSSGDNLLTLSGGGASSTSGDGNFNFGGSVSLGHMITDQVELLVSDSVAYSDASGATWINNVAGGAAFNFTSIGDGKFVPFVGGTIGYMSGAGNDTGNVTAMGGARYFLTESTFIVGTVSYGWGFDGSETNAVGYSIGLGFRF